jgi:PEGA domain-containing protein
MLRCRFALLLVTITLSMTLASGTHAKEAPLQVVEWPSTGKPVVRFSFGKFKEVASIGKQHAMTTDVTAENLWSKKISRADFVVYFYDKAKVRIGQGWLNVSDMNPAGVVKFQMTADISGVIATMEIIPQTLPAELQPALPPKTVSITVNSVPQGAEVKLDGTLVGTTPKIVQVLPGKHELLFSKEGFKNGTFPLEITTNDVSGGSVSYELGASAYDSVELRDGTVLSGDVESMSNTEVMIRVGGTIQSIDRNKVKRIALIQRDAPAQ